MPISLPLMPHRVSLNLIFRLLPGIYHQRDLKMRGKFPAMIFHAGTHVHSMNKTGYHEFEVKERFLAISPSAICVVSLCPWPKIEGKKACYDFAKQSMHSIPKVKLVTQIIRSQAGQEVLSGFFEDAFRVKVIPDSRWILFFDAEDFCLVTCPLTNRLWGIRIDNYCASSFCIFFRRLLQSARFCLNT